MPTLASLSSGGLASGEQPEKEEHEQRADCAQNQLTLPGAVRVVGLQRPVMDFHLESSALHPRVGVEQCPTRAFIEKKSVLLGQERAAHLGERRLTLSLDLAETLSASIELLLKLLV